MRLVRVYVLCALLCAAGAQRWTVNAHDGNFTEAPQRHVTTGSVFPLKVQVTDVLSRQSLSQAAVDVYWNYTRTSTGLTGSDGSVLLQVPFHLGLPITVMANKDGYVSALVPCAPDRRPLFSSVIVSLHRLNRGNIWLYEDSVLITSRTSAPTAQPSVRFPRSRLNVTQSGGVASVKAYLSVTERGGVVNATGIMSTASGYVSVGISPVAAVSIQLYSGDAELRVNGPIRISLEVPDSCGLQVSNAVPAWFFNSTTGGWTRKGLGTMTSVDGQLLWTFTAPHMGYWMAASLSPSPGFFGFTTPIDFLIHHWFELLVVVGGTLSTALCLLVVLIHHCKRGSRGTKAVKNQDQSTSTGEDQEVSTGSDTQPKVWQNQSFTEREETKAPPTPSTVHDRNTERTELNVTLRDFSGAQTTVPQQVMVPMCPTEGALFFYNQPLAMLRPPAFFHLEESEQQWSRSATLPRAGVSNGATDGETQTLPPAHPSDQSEEADSSPTRDPRGLSESASVPVTLHSLVDRRRPLAPPPQQAARAWFVSLEGTPAAEMHHAMSEQQRRRRRADSRDTSLDSGVDMSELSRTPSRRGGALERNATFVKNSATSRDGPPE
ncbi:protein FAM171B-like isoform X2 [Gouania willdenowi]|uniref:protein FAM171B-like isoform X2 n=1 Tax=Gouania willdenowi TaxID=441366 RepID=UPI001054E520|nr:protein FAM171B-like isoform X2 [Gouania willdenowi]